jgi:hypothetical protein
MAGRKGSQRRALVVLTLVNVLIGALIGAAVAGLRPDVFSYAFLVQAATLCSVGVSVLAEAGDMLFNRSEAEVLGPHPVGDTTLVAAKALNCVLYATWLALALNLVPAFAGLNCRDARPWFPLVHLAATVLTATACACFTVLAYEVLTRMASRERFDDAVAWAQVAMAVFFALGYQVVPRVLERVGSVSVPTNRWWLAFLPPAWMAGLEGTLGGRLTGLAPLLLTAAAIVVPAAASWIAISRLSRGHLEALSRLAETSARPAAPEGRRQGQRISRMSRRWPLRWWLRDPAERAAFRVVAAYLLRDRELRTRVYPQLAVLVIFPVLWWASADHAGSMFFAIAGLVTAGMFPAAVADLVRRSPHYAAADVFLASPLAGPGRLFLGATKAAIILFMPTGFVLALPFVAISSEDALVTTQLAVAALLVVPALTLLPGVVGSCVPLSSPVMRGEQSLRRIFYPLVGMTTLGVILAIAYQLRASPWEWAFLALEAALATLVARALYRRILSTSWEPET